jgi:transcriptional regulator with XRE-family HTH domain
MRKKSNQAVTAVSRLRKRLGLNQSQFWNRLGITQSAGSRYEKGRAIRKPIAILLELAYGDRPQQALKKLRNW